MKSYTTKNKNLIKEERNTRAHKNKPNRKDEEFRVSRKLMMFGRSLNRNVPIMDRRIAMSFYQLQDEYGYDRSSLELNYLTVLDPALIIGNVILTMITNIIDFNESLVHIGPIRHTAERTMRKDRTGEGVWAKIYNNKKLQRKKLNYIIKGLDDPRIQDIRFTDDDKSNSFKVEIKGKSGKFRNLLDIGFGFGQVLPVLLKCLDDFEIEKPSKPYKTMPKARRFNMPPPRIRPKNSINKCIIIEEPEVHLHPKLASSVARFFFTFSKDFNRTVIIETHSEHIIQTTQLVIKNVPDLANDTQILFMERKWNKKSANSAINIVNFDKDGTMLDEFPDDFFDYSHDLFKELIRKK